MTSALLAAAILPWATGFLWLAFSSRLDRGDHSPGSMYRCAGYGFFLGHALLFGLILASNALFGGVRPGAVHGLMLGLAVLGAWALYRRGRPPSREGLPQVLAGRGEHRWLKVLTWVLLAWLGLHVLLALTSVLATPVYSWDAWLVWMYRAKAWFHAGGLAAMADPQQWWSAASAPPYALKAFDYPSFVSVMGFWWAASLGHWSETLVNLPGWLCGIAIGLGLFGQCRSQGLSTAGSVTIAYLLFATPLFGTHMALGGYADIWMAGFCGLGLVALVSGITGGDRHQLALGWLMIILSLGVKNEGAAWLVAAAALAATVRLPARTQMLAAGGVLALVAIAWLAGLRFLELPLIGGVGVAEGRLHIPLIGDYGLATNPVWRSYLSHFFLLGSWNLVWLVMAVGVTASLWLTGRDRRTLLALLLIFAFTQFLIFGFTSKGRFATSGTSINRLPLHWLPVLLFAVGMAWQRIVARFPLRNGNSGWVRPWLAAMISATLVLIGTTLYLGTGSSPSGAEPVAPDFRFVTGSGRLLDRGMAEVETYRQGSALLSSGPVDFSAEQLPLLRVSLDLRSVGGPEPAFFWRQADQPDDVHRLGLDGRSLRDLGRSADWKGRITEFGILIPDPGDGAVRRVEMALEPRTLGALWQLSFRSWVGFEPWSLYSINFIRGGLPGPPVSLTLLAGLWALGTLMLLRTPGLRPASGLAGLIAVVLMAAWMLLDLRWTINGIRQLGQSVAGGLAHSNEPLLRAMPDAEIYSFIERFRQKHPGTGPRRILVVGDTYQYGYYMHRAVYHLLPDSAAVTRRLERGQEHLDYVLFVGDFAVPGRTWAETWRDLPIRGGWRDRIELVDSGAMTILFKVTPD